MDLWQYNQTKIIKRRVDDLTFVVFSFIAYEVGGIYAMVVFIILEVVMRIIKKEKKKKDYSVDVINGVKL